MKGANVAHEQQLPECKIRFEMMAEIRDELKQLRHVLLGNGSEGVIHQYQRRIQSIEDWRGATSSAMRTAKPAESGISGYLRQVPWWGWLLIAGTLGPEGWDAVKSIAISFTRGG